MRAGRGGDHRWKSLKVAIFGYAMNDMGDIRVDESALIRSLGPEILAVAPGDMYRGMQAVTDGQVADVIAFEDERFEIDPRLSAAEREDHARMQVAIEQILVSAGSAPTPRTSTRSARTAGSAGCRWPRPPP